MYFNFTHVIVAFVILAALDCLLTYYALRNTTGLREANPIMRFAIEKLGLAGGLLATHYVPLAVALYLAHTGNINGWGYIIDGIAFFGAVDIWDAWQLHKAGKM